MDLKTLIYTKNFGDELTHKLLHIADSHMWLEDLIDLCGELDESNVDCENDCEHVNDAVEEKKEAEKEKEKAEEKKEKAEEKKEKAEEKKRKAEENYDDLNTAVEDEIQELRSEMNNTDPRVPTEDIVDVLDESIDKYVEFKIKNSKISVGGIEVPKCD